MNHPFKSVVFGFYVGALAGAVSLATGCGGAPEQDEASDIGKVQQPVFAPRTANYVLGATNTQSALRCTTTSTGQICNVPMTKTFTYCENGLNAEELQQLTSVQSGGASQTAPFRFTWAELKSGGVPVRDAACQTAYTAGQCNVLVNHIDNFCAPAGASATNIDSLVCSNPTVTTGLLPEIPNVPGSFIGMNGGIIHIDRARLLAAFPVQPGRSEVLQHGLGHAAAALDGLGARTESTSTFLWTRRQVSPLSTLGRTHSNGEECTLNFYSATGGTNYTQDATSCISATPE